MRRWLLPLGLLCVAAALAQAAEEPLAYPPTKRGTQRVRQHGHTYYDHYRWLEDDDHEEVVAWDRAQRQLVIQRLQDAPRRKELHAALKAEFALGGMRSLPRFVAGMRWYTYQPKGHGAPLLYRTDAAASQPPRAILDPNRWSRDGTQQLRGWSVSPDGRFLAYLRADAKRGVTTLHFRDLNANRELPEFIERVRTADLVWLDDSSGFFYVRMPDPGSVPRGQAHGHPRLYLHRMGSLVLDDPMVYGRERPQDETFGLRRTADGGTLVLWRERPGKATEVFEARWADRALGLTALRPEPEPSADAAERLRVDRVGTTWVVTSTRAGGRRAVFTAPVVPEKPLGTLTPVGFPLGTTGEIRSLRIVGGRFLVAHVQDGLSSSLHVRAVEAGPIRAVPLPGPGVIGEPMTVEADTTRLWFRFESLASPPTRYRVDLASEPFALEDRDSLPTTLEPDALTSRRITIDAGDDASIPVTLLHRRDLQDTAAKPVLLTARSVAAGAPGRHDRVLALWADLGGVVAMASLRGEARYAVEDLIAVADGLVTTKVATRARLGLLARADAATLAAAALNRRPDLCRAVVLDAPVTDLLRLTEHKGGRAWVRTFGDPAEAQAYASMRQVSPLHTLRPAQAYPAVLLTTGLDDATVPALHARKLAAYWQQGSIALLPILLRVDRPGPDGKVQSPVARRTLRLLDTWSFLQMELDPAQGAD